MDSESLLALAAENQRRARTVLAELQAEAAWRSAGATPHLVGSLRTGLLMTHRDIDLHIYSPVLSPEGSFAAMARIARNPRIRDASNTPICSTPRTGVSSGMRNTPTRRATSGRST